MKINNCKIIFSGNKLINKFYFLINLADAGDLNYKFLTTDVVKNVWLSSKNKKEIIKFINIIKKHDYWDIENIFCKANHEKQAFKKLQFYCTKKEIQTIQKVFKLFDSEFENNYRKISRKRKKEFINLWTKPKYENIKNKLVNLFGDKNVYNVKVKFVFYNNFDGFLKGRAYDNNIVLGIPNCTKQSKLLEKLIFILLHELTHVFIKTNENIKFVIDRAIINKKMQLKFKKFNIHAENFIEETLIRLFIPQGYLFDNKNVRYIDNRKITWARAIEKTQIHPHSFSMMLLMSMYNTIKLYIQKNKPIDEKFINKMVNITNNKISIA